MTHYKLFSHYLKFAPNATHLQNVKLLLHHRTLDLEREIQLTLS